MRQSSARPARFGRVFSFILAAAATLFLLAAAWCLWALTDLPAIDPEHWRVQTPSVRITDRNGQVLYEVLDPQGGRQISLPLERIPPALRQATIATEDKSFYQNPGVDAFGVLRALWINLRGGEVLAGGSTITQQVARTLLMTPAERSQRSLRRKLREAVLAWQITQRYTKDEILALYLNQTYYGGMTYGAEAAARTYFGKPVEQLSLAECALLAGLPQAPALYNPFTNPEAAQQRRAMVLGLMEKQGYITSEQRRSADQQPLALASAPYPMQAPHFVMLVRSSIDRLYTPQEILESGGLVVRTTLDLNAQRSAEKAVADQLEKLRKSGAKHNVNNAAVVALDPHSGEVLAMVGSPDYFDARHNGAINMAIMPRQPGSALKPFLYALALDPAAPQPWTAATMILDVSTHFQTRDGKLYTPTNFNNQENGPVLVREALASSLNIPAVITLHHLGLENFIRLMHTLGVDTLSLEDADIALALGGGQVRLLDLTAAYAALANGGYRVQPVFILDIHSADGKTLYTAPQPNAARVLDARVAWLISDILSDDNARRLGFPAHSALNIGQPAAAKTGTTSNFHDNWTLGYTPDLAVGVWVGNTKNEPMYNITGLGGAAPIWHVVMRRLLAGKPPQAFERPPGLVQAEVCALSGMLPSAACTQRKLEWFIEGTLPQQTDTMVRRVLIDTASGTLASEQTPPERRMEVIALDLPPQAAAWARQRGLLLWADLLQGQSAAAPAQTAQAGLIIVSPGEGALYTISPRLPAESQQIRLEASAAAGLSNVVIYLNNKALETTSQPPYTAWWQLAPGSHTVWAQAEGADGKRITSPPVHFSVQAMP
ncbi:MAG: penicillin-binding protein 1C [Anaerolineae bacterium]|nr:penicillin-binding protein 1C [Anaerolineae bacterium]